MFTNLAPRTRAALLFALVSTQSCATPARTTTADERANLTSLLNKAELALEAAIATGAVRAEDAPHARDDVKELRKMIADSATIPTSIGDVQDEIAKLALRWVLAKS